MGFLQKIFGSNERELKKLRPIILQINAFSESIAALSDKELSEKTSEFKERLASGLTIDTILPEAFAVVREVAYRVIGERHYDVQLLGGIVLHQGKIAEMRTGEGKTLTSTLPIYLNALMGKGVHVVTVNDYLAKRDCNWMGSVYSFLGLSAACITSGGDSYIYKPTTVDENSVSIEYENLLSIERKDAYAADITYGTNNEFGFDYLRDNMTQSLETISQRGHFYAVVDEADSILIDEARTPLIISMPDSESTKLYEQFSQVVPRLKEHDDYEVDEKMKAVTLTDEGITKVEKILGVGNIYDPDKINYVHHLEQSLKAHIIFKKDTDYVVKDNQVIIVDDFTGRLMDGRRYSDGLHQAIEAKEGVFVQKESRTLASITFQNYFRMYEKLSGMTGTALTSAEELLKVYELDVLSIPPHKDIQRHDYSDVVYKSEKGKFDAIADKIQDLFTTGQPVLVGTIAIEKSEYLSKILTKRGIQHQVLNAKQHEKEATIIANAGQKSSVTIATNMAGRGTDIKLGEHVRELGGLFIIGTERHEARRIDNQLRGRSGRQGDPGASQFYISLEDELMRRFAGDKLKNMMNTLGLPEDQPIQNTIISKTIESAQSKIEGFNFDLRKHLLEYDDVMNKQRDIVYKKRRIILESTDVKNIILNYLSEEIELIVAVHSATDDLEWNTADIVSEVQSIFPLAESQIKEVERIAYDKSKDDPEKTLLIGEKIFEYAKIFYFSIEKTMETSELRSFEKYIVLQTMDTLWMNHLDEIDYIRQGIGLRGYGQRDPLIEYKKEAFNLFTALVANFRTTTLHSLFKAIASMDVRSVKLSSVSGPAIMANAEFSGASDTVSQFLGGSIDQDTKKEFFDGKQDQKPLIKAINPGRNEPCYCGNGRKYKKCHGK